MDKIYSRNRIKIPKLRIKTIKVKNIKKINSLLLIIAIAVLTAYTLINAINPIFEELCLEKLDAIATSIVSEEAGKVIKQFDYKNIVSIIKNGETNILKTDVSAINSLSTAITNAIIKQFKELEKDEIKIPAGALLGNRYLSGMGPNIKINIIPMGIVESKINTEFKAQGINQTMYRIYLNINCNMKVLMPYKTTSKTCSSQILLVETAIVGEVPETYYNLEGINHDDTLNFMD